MSRRHDPRQPLLSSSSPLISHVGLPNYSNVKATTTKTRDGEAFDDVPADRRQLGVFSAISLIFNRMIGTGIYATPSLILRASGSVGMFLVMWILGAIIASVGMAVYVEFGTGLPRNGGEKNYLEYVFPRPKLLATCLMVMYSCLMGWSAANSVVFGEYMVEAFGGQITQWNTRFIGFACLTAVTILHTVHLKWGLRVQNALAITKLGVMVAVILLGLSAYFEWIPLANKPHNFDNLWEGTILAPNALVSGMYSVTWSFIGYSNAHYALSETKDPVKTIKKAAPLAMILITAMFLLLNISYLLVVSKEEISDSGRVIAAHFFRKLFGPAAEQLFSIIICVSTLGNVMVICFAQSRVIQELGREGALPYSGVFSSNAPFNTPMAGLALQWAMCTFWLFFPPPGDAYNFVLNLHSYPLCWINAAISGGLLWLYVSRSGRSKWNPPFRAGIPAIVTFLLANVFLAVAPLVPPSDGFSLYDHLPYWLHVAASGGLALIGATYWFVWARMLPRLGGYRLNKETVIDEDGASRTILKKVW